MKYLYPALLYMGSLLAGLSSLTLEEAEEIALAENKAILLAGQFSGQSGARRWQSISAWFPRLSFSSMYMMLQKPQTLTPLQQQTREFSNQFQLNQPILSTDLIYGLRTARLALDSAKSDQDKSVIDTLYDVRSAYYAVILRQRATQVQKEVIDFLKAAQADEQVKLDAGKSILFELNQSKVALSNAIAKSHMIAKDLKEAKTALILSLGIDPLKETELVLSETDFPVQNYPWLVEKIKQVKDHPDMPLYSQDEISHWTLLAKERKPEIKKAQYYLQAAAEQVKGRKARYLPTISAFADYGYYVPTNGVFFKQQNNFAGGVVLNWNIFDSFKREFEIQEYSALRKGARIALEQENDKTALRMRDLLFKIEEGIYTYTSAVESLKLAEEGMNDARIRLSSGTITPLQYRDATRSFAEVRQQSDTAEYMLLQAYFQLLHDAGEDIYN